MNGCTVATKPNICFTVILLIGAVFYFSSPSIAQDFKFHGRRTRDAITFESVKNLVIIPLYINGKGPFNFILDTGVGPTIITDSTLIDSLQIKSLTSIKISGLGKGKEIDAKITSAISVTIAEATANFLPTVLLEKDPFNLSSYLGKKIYGLIGYSFFNSFIVSINYGSKKLSFSTVQPRKAFKGDKISIEIIQLKPYVNAAVENASFGKKMIKLLIDCGAGHSLSLEKLDGAPWVVPQRNIKGNLGVGLAGEISGRIARLDYLTVGRYHFKNVVTNFPDFDNAAEKSSVQSRSGSLGADILRRFNTVYDYRNGVIYLQKNGAFKDPFDHDMSGMEIYGDDGKYFVARVEEDSSAEKAGILVDDQIIGINFKPIAAYGLNDLVNLFKANDGATIIMELYRKDRTIIKLLRLQRRI